MDGIVVIFGIASVFAVFMFVRNTINFIREGKQGQGVQEPAPKTSVNHAITTTPVQEAKVDAVKKEDVAKKEATPASTAATQIPIQVQGSVDGNDERIARIEGIIDKYVNHASEAKE